MFTNNYVKFQKMRFMASGYSYSEKGFVNAGGSSFTTYMAVSFVGDIGHWMSRGKCRAIEANSSFTMSNSAENPGVYFGTDQTPATKEDYKLGSPITSGLTIQNPSNVTISDEGDGVYSCVSNFILTNTSEADINIYEIGIFTPLSSDNKYSLSGSMNWHNTLMDRTVLTEPITIPTGESKFVSYRITFNQGENI